MLRALLLVFLAFAAFMGGKAPPIMDFDTGEATSVAFKIFYFHVPSAMVGMFLALPISAFASACYLAKGRESFDRTAQASAEVGLLWATAVIISGPLWAKPAWGTYWTWEPRLTTFLILWLVYIGYHIFRHSIDDPLLRSRRAAVYNLMAALTIPFVHFSIKYWGRASHPPPGGGFFKDPAIAGPFYLNLTAFALLTIHFIFRRVATIR